MAIGAEPAGAEMVATIVSVIFGRRYSQETGDKSGEMTGFEKRALHGYGSQLQRTAPPDLIRMRTAIGSLEKLDCCDRRPPLRDVQPAGRARADTIFRASSVPM